MKPFWPLRRSWNWPRLFRRFRQDAVSTLSSAAFFCILLIVAVVTGIGRATLRLRRRVFGWPSQEARTIAPVPTTRASGISRRHVLVLDNSPASSAPTESGAAASQHHYRSTADEQSAKEAANATVLANLNLCLSPPAILAVAEDAVARSALYWHGLESVFARLIQVEGKLDDVCDLMTICHFDWLYTKPVKRRVIRLIGDSRVGGMRWQHMSKQLICFEFDGVRKHPELHPAHKLFFSSTQLRIFFDAQGRFVHWDRPYVGKRPML